MLPLELMMQVGLFIAVLVFVRDRHEQAIWVSQRDIAAKYDEYRLAALDRAVVGARSGYRDFETAYRDFEIACASEALFLNR